ncbi:MAG: hypothetical protein GF418_07715 [Chitinivibrionales bacterium]|nr:hypothetical protein [Chitinivibrionales bacterium]MBD3395500.1 hypothetical protein [Chitinivibrionales bacterium]
MVRRIALVAAFCTCALAADVPDGAVKPRRWIHLSVADITAGAGAGPVSAHVDGGLFAVGAPPPLGFGFGIAMVAMSVPLYQSEDWFSPVGVSSTLFPLYLYYVPFARWKQQGKKPDPLVALYVSGGYTPDEGENQASLFGSRFKGGIKLQWYVAAVESAVIYAIKTSTGERAGAFFVGGTISIGVWRGITRDQSRRHSS